METIGLSGVILGGLLAVIATAVLATLVVTVMWASAAAVVAPVMSGFAAGARRARRVSWCHRVRDSWLGSAEDALGAAGPRRPPVQGLAIASSHDAGAEIRFVAADVARATAAQGDPCTSMGMMHARLAPSGRLELPPNPSCNVVVYVLTGSGTVGPQRQPVRAGQLVVVGPESTVSVAASERAGSSPLEVLIFGQGSSAEAAAGEPVVSDGSAVRDRLRALLALTDDLPLPEQALEPDDRPTVHAAAPAA